MQNYFYFDGKKIPVNISESDSEIFLSFPYFKELIEEIKESTDLRRYIKESKTWALGKTRRNYWLLSILLGVNPYCKYDKNKANLTQSKLDKVIHYINNLNPPLYKHQPDMFLNAFTKKQWICAGEMRTGKTRPILELLKYLNINNAWWVAPGSALRGLQLELQKWNFPLEIKLFSYNSFRTIINYLPDIKLLNKDFIKENKIEIPNFIVFDESQKLKNTTAKQSQMAKDLSDIQEKVYGENRWLILLSGTPSPKDPSDWWNQTEIVCPGYLREGHVLLFKKRLANMVEDINFFTRNKFWKLESWKIDEIEKLKNVLSGLVSVYFKKDCFDLPEKIYTNIEMDISIEYRNMANMIRQKESRAITLQQKLRQLSDGFLYINTPDKITAKQVQTIHYFKDCPKDEQLKLDLEEYGDIGRIIIYAGFTASINKISNICLENNWIVLKVNKDGMQALGTHLSNETLLKEMDRSKQTMDTTIPNFIEKLAFVAQSSVVTGLELSASPVIIYYSNDDNGAARMQSEDRPHSNNMDKERGLEIRDYFHLPIDKLVLDRHRKKQSLQAITLGDIDKIMNFTKEVSNE